MLFDVYRDVKEKKSRFRKQAKAFFLISAEYDEVCG